jgi:hypothetical protein
LNNAFSNTSFENIDLQSGENVTLIIFGGIQGYSIAAHEVPYDDSMGEIKPPAFALKPGRNMVSFQLEPQDPDVLTVLAPILDDLSSIWAFDSFNDRWIFHVKNGLPFLNELDELHSGTGFLLFMENEASWPVNGSFIQDPIALKAGRNLVGFRVIQSTPVLDAVEPITDHLISIWFYDLNSNKWKFYVKNGLPFLNELNFIEPGMSYWVYVDGDCQL